MGMQHSTYVFYGVLVGAHNAKVDEQNSYEVREFLAEQLGDDTEMVTEHVRHFMCGDYDRNDIYLIIDQDGNFSREVSPGDVRTLGLGPELPTDQWNVWLADAADELGLEILHGPRWFVVPDVS